MTSIDTVVKSVIQSKDWKFLNEKILLSVLEQESELEPFFSKDDKQYKANMRVASGALSMTEPQVLKLVTLKNGQIAKFRLETGYFFSKKWEKLSPLKRFYWASSWGLGQKMACYGLLNKVPEHQWAAKCLEFAGNIEAQVKMTANDMEDLLLRASRDLKITDKSLKNLVFHAYVGYNAGSIHSKNAAAQARAAKVVSRI